MNTTEKIAYLTIGGISSMITVGLLANYYDKRNRPGYEKTCYMLGTSIVTCLSMYGIRESIRWHASLIQQTNTAGGLIMIGALGTVTYPLLTIVCYYSGKATYGRLNEDVPEKSA